MAIDRNLAHAKQAELLRIALETVPDTVLDREELGRRIISAFSQIIPPEDGPLEMRTIILTEAGRSGGLSRKPGNLILSWGKFFSLIPDIVLASAGTSMPPLASTVRRAANLEYFLEGI